MCNKCGCGKAIVSNPGDLCYDCKSPCWCGKRKTDGKDWYGIVAGYCWECTPKCVHGNNPKQCWCKEK